MNLTPVIAAAAYLVKQKVDNMSECREFNSLTNDDLIRVVDFLAYNSRPVSIGGDMYYRKIEVKHHDDGLLFRISYSEDVEGEKEIVGWMLAMEDSDIIIYPVTTQRFEEWFVKDFVGVNQIFYLDTGIKATFCFFNEELEFWNTDKSQFLRTEPLTHEWYTLEEYSRSFTTIKKV